MHDSDPSRAGGSASPLHRLAVGAALLAGVRAGLLLVRRATTTGEVDEATLSAASRAFAESFLVGLVGLGLVFLAGRAARGRLSVVVPAALACAALAYAWASYLLPPAPMLVPDRGSTAGLVAHAGVGLVALLATWSALGSRRELLERAAGRLAGVAFLAAVGTALLTGAPPASWPERPNLVLVSLDTLRADHLGSYGYERETTPELDRFAADAVRFERAYSPEGFTLTAHMTMHTSLQPYVHGVRQGTQLAPQVRTLADVLGEAGYVTLAVLDDCVWLAPRWGFARGFDLYYRVGKPAAFQVDEVLAAVDLYGDRPFFLFAHFFDAHSDVERLPYEGADEDVRAFTEWYEGEFDGCDEEGRCGSRFLSAANERGFVASDEVRRYIVSLYDAGVRTLDRELGRMFDGLAERGLLDISVVLVTADHGEEFWEHGQVLHGQSFDHTLRVPLLLRTPDTSGGVRDVTVSLGDVMPTLLDFAGLELSGLGGRSLRPALSGESLAELPIPTSTTGRLTGFRLGSRALVRHEGRFLRFDTEADPGQQQELEPSEEDHAIFARLQAELDPRRELLAPREDGDELTPEEREALRDLGYLGD